MSPTWGFKSLHLHHTKNIGKRLLAFSLFCYIRFPVEEVAEGIEVPSSNGTFCIIRHSVYRSIALSVMVAVNDLHITQGSALRADSANCRLVCSPNKLSCTQGAPYPVWFYRVQLSRSWRFPTVDPLRHTIKWINLVILRIPSELYSSGFARPALFLGCGGRLCYSKSKQSARS